MSLFSYYVPAIINITAKVASVLFTVSGMEHEWGLLNGLWHKSDPKHSLWLSGPTEINMFLGGTSEWPLVVTWATDINTDSGCRTLTPDMSLSDNSDLDIMWIQVAVQALQESGSHCCHIMSLVLFLPTAYIFIFPISPSHIFPSQWFPLPAQWRWSGLSGFPNFSIFISCYPLDPFVRNWRCHHRLCPQSPALLSLYPKLSVLADDLKTFCAIIILCFLWKPVLSKHLRHQNKKQRNKIKQQQQNHTKPKNMDKITKVLCACFSA